MSLYSFHVIIVFAIYEFSLIVKKRSCRGKELTNHFFLFFFSYRHDFNGSLCENISSGEFALAHATLIFGSVHLPD